MIVVKHEFGANRRLSYYEDEQKMDILLFVENVLMEYATENQKCRSEGKKAMTKIIRENIWTLEQGVTPSLLRTFACCKEHFRLQYVEGYSSTGVNEALEFGSIVHYLLEYVYKENDPQPTRGMLDNLLEEYNTNRLEELNLDKGFVNPQEHEKLEKLYAVALEVVQQYFCHYDETEDELEFLATEQEFDFYDDDLQIRMRGKIDGVLQGANNTLTIFDTKTKSRIDINNLCLKLPKDLQMMFYARAVEKIYEQKVRKVIYNLIQRPQQRQKKTENLKAYCNRICGEIQEEPTNYFKRIEMDLELSDFKRFEKEQLKPILWDLKEWVMGGNHYFNPDALEMYGKPSRFFNAILADNFEGLVKRKKVFPELERS